mmetsp:Transcript_909/g.2015  ORF Transcript_909/g.2015 Transcript_909/m.2015 type:complete len:227 (-) Transcript_909:476-1156(-)
MLAHLYANHVTSLKCHLLVGTVERDARVVSAVRWYPELNLRTVRQNDGAEAQAVRTNGCEENARDVRVNHRAAGGCVVRRTSRWRGDENAVRLHLGDENAVDVALEHRQRSGWATVNHHLVEYLVLLGSRDAVVRAAHHRAHETHAKRDGDGTLWNVRILWRGDGCARCAAARTCLDVVTVRVNRLDKSARRLAGFVQLVRRQKAERATREAEDRWAPSWVHFARV